MCVTCPAHLILFVLNIIVKLGEEYRLWSPSLCSFLHSSNASHFFGPNILLRIYTSTSPYAFMAYCLIS
jgi:hypothetical protein